MTTIPVMINGLPGKMAAMIEERLSRRNDFEVIPFSLTGPGMSTSFLGRTSPISLIEPEQHEEVLQKILLQPESNGLIAIDFTLPAAVERNVRIYCKHGIPFVMGTTGGNREILPKLVEASDISAVIAPNMSAPIVMFMDMVMHAAENYPGTLSGWEIRIIESHQAAKEDVSGTALAVGRIFAKNLGVNFDESKDVRPIRDRVDQLLAGIPDWALEGHGWHKYSLLSPDGNIMLGFEHNINGRSTYVDGTLMALEFLAKKVSTGSQGECFNMPDVMRG